MSYSMQFQQMCTLCNNPNDLLSTRTEQLNPSAKKTKTVLKCEHVFHTRCIVEHFKKKMDCPTCHVQILKEVPDNITEFMEALQEISDELASLPHTPQAPAPAPAPSSRSYVFYQDSNGVGHASMMK